jgi:hypothetical protein
MPAKPQTPPPATGAGQSPVGPSGGPESVYPSAVRRLAESPVAGCAGCSVNGISNHVSTLEEIVCLILGRGGFIFQTRFNTSMIQRPTWSFGSGAFLLCIILAGIVVNMTMRTPNTVGGGGGMMFFTIVLAVVFKIILQHFTSKRKKRIDEKLRQDDNRDA